MIAALKDAHEAEATQLDRMKSREEQLTWAKQRALMRRQP